MTQGLHALTLERPLMPLAKRLACAVIALARHERAVNSPVLVVLPEVKADGRLETVMLGDLLLELGEDILVNEPHAAYDVLLDSPRERFLELVRDAADDLEAAAEARRRLHAQP